MSTTQRRSPEPQDLERPNVVPRPQIHLRDQHIEERAPLTSAERIAAKFGGVGPLHKLLNAQGYKIDRTVVWRWTVPYERGGTGGIIPRKHHDAIFRLARMEGIVLTPEDFWPRHDIRFG